MSAEYRILSLSPPIGVNEALSAPGDGKNTGMKIIRCAIMGVILSGYVAAANNIKGAGNPDTEGASMPPLFEKDRPDWEIKFTDLSNSVLSVMPGESDKTFYDPLIKRDVKWEQDVYCPTFTVYDNKLYCVYRSWGEDSQWRMGLAWSEDGLNFTRADKPVFYAKPGTSFWATCVTWATRAFPTATPGCSPTRTAHTACFSITSASAGSTGRNWRLRRRGTW
jgi:hypothetical protein